MERVSFFSEIMSLSTNGTLPGAELTLIAEEMHFYCSATVVLLGMALFIGLSLLQEIYRRRNEQLDIDTALQRTVFTNPDLSKDIDLMVDDDMITQETVDTADVVSSSSSSSSQRRY